MKNIKKVFISKKEKEELKSLAEMSIEVEHDNSLIDVSYMEDIIGRERMKYLLYNVDSANIYTDTVDNKDCVLAEMLPYDDYQNYYMEYKEFILLIDSLPIVDKLEIGSINKNKLIERDKTHQGKVYKNYLSVITGDICYIPELTDTSYTFKDLVDTCEGDEKLALQLLEELSWESPESLYLSYIEDMDDNKEQANKNISYKDKLSIYYEVREGFIKEDISRYIEDNNILANKEDIVKMVEFFIDNDDANLSYNEQIEFAVDNIMLK